jgi:hypothetical protein
MLSGCIDCVAEVNFYLRVEKIEDRRREEVLVVATPS